MSFLVCVTAAWLIGMHVFDKLDARLNDLQHRIDRIERQNRTPSDGFLDPWEHLLIYDGPEERRDWVGGTDIR